MFSANESEALAALEVRLSEFAERRNWIQYHSPKNLTMALAGEVGELLAEFQWLTEEQSSESTLTPSQALKVEGEVADVFIYLVRLSTVLGIDLIAAANRKITVNEGRFPPSEN